MQCFFEYGNEDVITSGNKAPKEKDDNQRSEGAVVRFLHGIG
jgi:hypothetical protein